VTTTEKLAALDEFQLTAVRLAYGMEIRPAAVGRDWMDTPAGRFAKRCLPLMIANQAGWELLNPSGFSARWDGGEGLGAITIWPDLGQVQWVVSHFGSGVLTWHVPYLFRTPPGYNLHVRGPANVPKDGIGPLEGIIEADWAIATFTMNWRFTRPDHTVRFEANEPFAMIAPVRRGELERFRPVFREGHDEPAVFAAFQRFAASRQEFLSDLKLNGSAAEQAGWQRDYFLGRDIDGGVATEHQTRLRLSPFASRADVE